MKLFSQRLVMPILFRMGGLSQFDGKYGLRFLVRGMAGSMTTTTYMIQYRSSFHEWEVSVCWRPSVTRYWWNDSIKINHN